VTFSQVVWLIGCWLVLASHKWIHKLRKQKRSNQAYRLTAYFLGWLTAACLPALLLWLPSLLLCGFLIRLTACLLGWLIAAYLPALLWLTGLVICGLSARLIMAYLPGSLLLIAGFLPLTGLVICGLLARLTITHWALTDLVSTRLKKKEKLRRQWKTLPTWS